jgi:ATP-binding protein involved in chromosome partitioning
VVDLVLHTPAMHIKKRAEDDIKKAIPQIVFLIIKINSKVEVADKPEVKGKAIPGIKK